MVRGDGRVGAAERVGRTRMPHLLAIILGRTSGPKSVHRSQSRELTGGTSIRGVEKSPSWIPIVRPRNSAENLNSVGFDVSDRGLRLRRVATHLSARQHAHHIRFRIAFSFSVNSSRPLCIHLSGLRLRPRSYAYDSAPHEPLDARVQPSIEYVPFASPCL